jgi:hypothetical protein
MADAVNTTVIYQDTVRYVVKITNLSDGTGETAVTKVDKSTLTGPNGLEPTELVVECIDADVAGMQVYLYADHTTDVPIARIGGLGRYKRDFRKTGGLSTAGAGDTGDILLTTNGHSSGDSYDITLYLRKKD